MMPGKMDLTIHLILHRQICDQPSFTAIGFQGCDSLPESRPSEVITHFFFFFLLYRPREPFVRHLSGIFLLTVYFLARKAI